MIRLSTSLLFVSGLWLCISVGCQNQDAPPLVPEPTPAQPVEVEAKQVPIPKLENVILITADTMRGDVADLDGGPVKMGHLRTLAEEGWHFEQAYSNSMLTTPSHISLMTSLYPRDHGVYHNEGGVDGKADSLAKKLSDAGYFNAAVIGFPHLNPNVSNLGLGFSKIIEATRENRTASETVELGMDILKNRPTDKPFFMWLHMVDPHAPYEQFQPGDHRDRLLSPSVPMARAIKAAPGFQKNNPWFKKTFKKHKTTQPLLEHYNDEVLEVDVGLGKLIEALKAQNLWDNTAIVFTSDHGENLGERELYFHHGGLYDAAIGVPLVIRIPGAPPVKSPVLTQTVDIAPTIMGLLGLESWPDARGQNLQAVIAGEQEPAPYVFADHLYAQQAAVRSKSHTLIYHRKNTRQFPSYAIKKGKYEFFERGLEGKETQAVPLSDPAAEDLKKVLKDYLANKQVWQAQKAIKQDMESLKALGYIE